MVVKIVSVVVVVRVVVGDGVLAIGEVDVVEKIAAPFLM